ncbi:hypothetical protein G3M48_004261 [Beauveria asiatica]|uniref:Uncharacterized protein n=1 Tax=Beauveria asiatica TaxID=1069075 RepID=A0AAW0RTV1_9HYPO
MFISASIVSNQGPYFAPMSCAKLLTFYTNTTALQALHPACSDLSAWSLARASMSGDAENAAAALSITFGAAIWLALAMHAIGVEFYQRVKDSGRFHTSDSWRRDIQSRDVQALQPTVLVMP